MSIDRQRLVDIVLNELERRGGKHDLNAEEITCLYYGMHRVGIGAVHEIQRLLRAIKRMIDDLNVYAVCLVNPHHYEPYPRTFGTHILVKSNRALAPRTRAEARHSVAFGKGHYAFGIYFTNGNANDLIYMESIKLHTNTGVMKTLNGLRQAKVGLDRDALPLQPVLDLVQSIRVPIATETKFPRPRKPLPPPDGKVIDGKVEKEC